MDSDKSALSAEEGVNQPSESDCLLKADEVNSGWRYLLLENPLSTLHSIFGHNLLVLIFVHQHLQKGFLSGLKGAAVPYLYKAYAVAAPQVQVFSGVTQLPWAMKPLIGLASDLLPIGGYSKVPYVGATTLIGIAACAVVALAPQSMLPLSGLVVCFFLVQLQNSTGDLLSEAKYTSKIQDNPKHGSSLVSFVWFGLQLAGLLAVLLAGHMISNFGPRSAYGVAAVLLPLIFIPMFLGYWEDRQKTVVEASEARARAFEHPETALLCFIMLAATVVLSICGMLVKDEVITCVVGLAVMAVVLISFSLVLSPIIAKVNAFALIQTSLMFPISGAAFYFYTDSAKEYPEGPHFTPFFYNTVMGTVGAVCSLLGIILYQRYLSTWTYRNIIMFTNLTVSGLCLSDAIMFSRINVRLGIPDQIFVLGSAALETIVFQWMWMPHVVILSYLCPKGREATMYALLAGCSNLGNTIASNCGALLIHSLGCSPSGATGESAQFQNLWIASLVATCLPFITALLLVKLLPDTRPNEKLLTGEAAQDPTAGSLWKKWRQQNSQLQ